ncbi:CLUMA_CG002409, isoform A [Clunio marinus]|uniref:CLUMA_CG002409, isoform A n=1 Tax=Clunio marinus TaxID=568069 RepID=A0A1J1HMH4_9DIPT|nr:CLUMA_CG002409, isoform A [Clunio marinus]
MFSTLNKLFHPPQFTFYLNIHFSIRTKRDKPSEDRLKHKASFSSRKLFHKQINALFKAWIEKANKI